MKVEYHPGLVEKTVLHAVYGAPDLEAELHRQTDPLYASPPSSDREASFTRLYGSFFERLALDRTLRRLLEERPVIPERVGSCKVGPALRASQESAELLVRGNGNDASRGDRTVMLQVCPATLAEPERLARRMRPELFHIADMVDPAFRYRRQQIEGLPSRRNLIRDRYRVLWEIYIAGRLERERRGEGTRRSELSGQLARVFGMASTGAVAAAFALIFDARSLTHEQLFHWASDPDPFRERETDATRAATPGANCPLCGFSTFDWFSFEAAADEQRVLEIKRRYRSWNPAHGACRQCAEIYAVVRRPDCA